MSDAALRVFFSRVSVIRTVMLGFLAASSLRKLNLRVRSETAESQARVRSSVWLWPCRCVVKSTSSTAAEDVGLMGTVAVPRWKQNICWGLCGEGEAVHRAAVGLRCGVVRLISHRQRSGLAGLSRKQRPIWSPWAGKMSVAEIILTAVMLMWMLSISHTLSTRQGSTQHADCRGMNEEGCSPLYLWPEMPSTNPSACSQAKDEASCLAQKLCSCHCGVTLQGSPLCSHNSSQCSPCTEKHDERVAVMVGERQHTLCKEKAERGLVVFQPWFHTPLPPSKPASSKCCLIALTSLFLFVVPRLTKESKTPLRYNEFPSHLCPFHFLW